MTSLQVSLLGTFQAKWEGVLMTQFRSDKIRALFAYLAVESDVPHRREVLATLLWPDSSNAVALRNLRKSLHRLRQTLNAHDPNLSEQVLSVNRQTVTWCSALVDLDTSRFLKALTAVETHLHHSLHGCPECLNALTQALTDYHGDFLTGISISNAIGFEEWAAVKREMLHQKALSTLHQLTLAYKQLGDFEQAHAYAVRQILLEPWREEAHRQLMQVLALQGEHSRALKQFQLCRDVLLTELGTSPTHKTVQLYEQIKEGTFPISAADIDNQIGLHHFPPRFNPFVGRTAEIKVVVDNLLNDECHLLTVVGPGGIGKTRLCQEAVQHMVEHCLPTAETVFADGCYFVPLTEVFCREQLVVSIATTLQFTFQAADNLEEQLIAYLLDKRLLILLDNFEQLVDSAHDLIDHLLQAAPGLQLLISSRELLLLRAEWQLRLDGLAYPAYDKHTYLNSLDTHVMKAEEPLQFYAYSGVSLFVQAAQHAQPSFRPNAADLRAIAHICQLTQGAPLALEIAAVWIKMIDCCAIADQITKNLDFLSSTQRDMPDRHRSMRAVFEQSWASLPSVEQTALAQISMFRGGFSLEAALAVLEDALLTLSALLDKSLLRKDGNGRYQIHTLLHQFSAEKLSETEPELLWHAESRYCKYYFDLIASQGRQFSQAAAGINLETIQAEIDNLRHAWRWAVTHSQWEALLNATEGLPLFHHIPSAYQDWIAALSNAIDKVKNCLALKHEPQAEKLLNRLRIQQIKFFLGQHQFKQVKILAQETCADCRLQMATEALAIVLADLGIAHWRLGNVPDSIAALEESLELTQKLSMPLQMAYVLHHLGNIAIVEREYERSQNLLSEAMGLYEESGNSYHLANVINDLGSLNFACDNLVMAQIYYQRSLNLCRQVNSITGSVTPQTNLIYAALVIEDYELAQVYSEALSAFAIKNHINLSFTSAYHINKGHIALMKGEHLRAAREYKKGLGSSESMGERIEMLLGLSAVIIAGGNQAVARQLIAVVDDVWANHPPVVSPFEWRLLQRCKDDLSHTRLECDPDMTSEHNLILGPDEAILIALAEIDSMFEQSSIPQ